MHCHWGERDHIGSEHTLNGEHFDMECHLVWFNVRYKTKDEALKHKNGITVMALLFKVGSTLTPNDQRNLLEIF